MIACTTATEALRTWIENPDAWILRNSTGSYLVGHEPETVPDPDAWELVSPDGLRAKIQHGIQGLWQNLSQSGTKE